MLNLKAFRRGLFALAIVVVAVVLFSAAGSDKSEGHTLRAEMASAQDLVSGVEVRVAGRPAGRVRSVEATRAGRAKVEIEVDDDVWPLPVGTTFGLRTAGTIAFGGRYVELTLPTRRGGPTLADGASFPTRDIKVPVEFDEVFNTFDETTRRRLRVTVDRSGAALARAQRPLRRVVRSGPPALKQASGVLRDLDAQSTALKTLVDSGDAVTAAVQRSNPGLDTLLSTASTTLSATGSRAAQLRSAIEQAPGTLTSARSTLGQASTTLKAAKRLTTRVSSGIDEIRRTARPLSSTLTTVAEVAPKAKTALDRLGSASPALTTLLVRGREQAPLLERVAAETSRQVNCIRPYTPEIIAIATNWSDFLSRGDDLDKVGRVVAGNIVFPNATPLNSEQAHDILPSLNPAFMRPAGNLSGQSYWQPECGKTPEALLPKNDPDNRR